MTTTTISCPVFPFWSPFFYDFVNEEQEGENEPNHNPMPGLPFLVCFFFKEFADEEQEEMRNQTAVQRGDQQGTTLNKTLTATK